MLLVATTVLVLWLVLLSARGGFWRFDRRLPHARAAGSAARVVAVVPARDEEATIAETVRALVAQDHDRLAIVVVDDASGDQTVAHALEGARGGRHAVRIVAARPLPRGWNGKPWAMASGVAATVERDGAPDWWFFTDADIVHDPDVVRRLVALAEADRRDMVSLMVRLPAGSSWERLLVPAFVFFFAKLYPFRWVADPGRRIAAAAGGAMLVRAEALARAGGIAAVRRAWIDDCALAAAVKGAGGRLWLGLGGDSRSLRRYPALGGFWRMVRRSAYAELQHSPLRLAGAVAGMAVAYLAAPAIVLALPWHGDLAAALVALAAWTAMAVAYRPIVAWHGLSPAWAMTLPVAAMLFTAMTIDSAWASRRAGGIAWKGRDAVDPGAAP